VHAWHANASIQDAAQWSFAFFKKTGVDLANPLPNKPQMYIAEVGWPTNPSVPGVGPSAASVENLQLSINNFVCTDNTQEIKYFFFEYIDIPWENKTYLVTDGKRGPGVEGSWGLFNSDRTLKAITLPDCASE